MAWLHTKVVYIPCEVLFSTVTRLYDVGNLKLPQRQHDGNADGDFLSAVGRQIEDQQCKYVDTDTRDNQIDRVVQDLAPYLQP